jgi:hypothetical protein
MGVGGMSSEEIVLVLDCRGWRTSGARSAIENENDDENENDYSL